jgi:NCAIR mutase (PurE)-related protein
MATYVHNHSVRLLEANLSRTLQGQQVKPATLRQLNRKTILMNEYEVKVTYTTYVGVEAYNKEQAIEQAKEIVAHNYNTLMSHDSDYEITGRFCESCDNQLSPEDGRLCDSCRQDWKESENQ